MSHTALYRLNVGSTWLTSFPLIVEPVNSIWLNGRSARNVESVQYVPSMSLKIEVLIITPTLTWCSMRDEVAVVGIGRKAFPRLRFEPWLPLASARGLLLATQFRRPLLRPETL